MNRRELQRMCKKFSLTVEDGSKHLHIRDPEGRLIAVMSKGTKSSYGRAEQNLRAYFRRMSANPPP